MPILGVLDAATRTSATSAPATFDRTFSELLGKVRHEITPQTPIPVREATINILFSGGGAVLPSIGLAGLVQVTFNSTIVWAYMYAGDDNLFPVDVTAVVGLWFGGQYTFPPAAPLWGQNAPSLTATSFAQIDTTTWTANLLRGDIITYRMFTFSGTATWMSLNIGIRATPGEEGSADLVDYSDGNTLVDSSGNTVRFRT